AVPIDALVIGYIIGYIANMLPVPGGFGVLEGGLAGTLILYGAAPTQAAAAVVVYHAITFWVPSLGGLVGFARLRRRPTRSVRALADRASNGPAASTPSTVMP
ncbi:MAG: lysylphosphatidylglycerol synthase domain-containing protein, partial [Solirubrobacteraceae bacterium]